MVRRIAPLLALLAALTLAIAPADAMWAGYNWRVSANPPTVVPLCDLTNAALHPWVQQIAALWSSETAVFKIDYHASGCKAQNGWISVQSGYTPGAAASYTTLKLAGNKSLINSAGVELNTWNSVFASPLDPTLDGARQYLICHEMGGALGLQEFSSPYDPNSNYYYGCMNLQWQGPNPSQEDIDTLNRVY